MPLGFDFVIFLMFSLSKKLLNMDYSAKDCFAARKRRSATGWSLYWLRLRSSLRSNFGTEDGFHLFGADR